MTDVKTLRVGIDDAPPAPMQVGNPETGDFEGYEVDLLEHLAGRLDCEIEYRRALWSVIVKELESDCLDVICSAATVTPERMSAVDFCTSHLGLRLGLVVHQSSGDLDLRNARIGIRRGTTAESFFLARVPGSNPAMASESNEELYAALVRGDLDGVIDDSPIARYFARAKSGLAYAQGYPGTEGEYAIVVRKGNDELKDQINRELAMMESDGTLTALRKRWFGAGNFLVA